MTGNSTPRRVLQREDVWCKSSEGAEEGPLEPRVGNGPPVPAVTGSECVPARYEFRWNHGQDFVRPEPNNRLRAFFYGKTN